MFHYLYDNAEFLSKKVESIKKSYFFRKWTHFLPQNQIVQVNFTKVNQKNVEQEAEILSEDMEDKPQKSVYSQDLIEIQDEQQMKQEQSQEKMISGPPSMANQQQQQDANNIDILEDETPQQAPALNLKFGDIIYWKYYFQSRQKGIVCGDGIANNKLELIPQFNITPEEEKDMMRSIDQQSEMKYKSTYIKKNAQLMFRKCLFKVVNSKKYFYQQLLKQKEHIKSEEKQNEDLKTKVQTEQEENTRLEQRIIGSNVIYGDEIQLIHIYSNCILTLNPKILAQANCCREMSLEEEANEFSNFRILSINNAKKLGETVLYSDQIALKSSSDKTHWIHVTDGSIFDYQQGLEVNAYSKGVPLKLCCFMDGATYIKREDYDFKAKFLDNGDIIYLNNRDQGGNLGVKIRIQFEGNVYPRRISFDYESRESIQFEQPYYDFSKQYKNINQQYQVYLHKDTQQELEISALWEIQKTNSFNSVLPSFKEQFRLKNLASGLYLCIDKKGELALSYEGVEPNCLFQLIPKKAVIQENKLVRYNLQVQIFGKNQYGEIVILQCLDPEEFNELEQQNPYQNHIMAVKRVELEKWKKSRCFFEINHVNSDVRRIADRVSSLMPYLINFYIFLQEFGIQPYGPQLYYKVKVAFENQKALYTNVQQLFQSLDNINQFLLTDDEQQLRYRQNILLNNGILNILVSILKLIHFHIYGNPKCILERQQKAWSVVYKNKEIPERSAQQIAKLKLEKAVFKIYEIITKILLGNPECSSALLQNQHKNNLSSQQSCIDFFLDQQKFYPFYIKKLLIEAVKQQIDEETAKITISQWVQKLETISEANIDDQTFILELLGLNMIDNMERTMKISQNFVRKQLFKPTMKDPINGNLMIPAEVSLIRFKVEKDVFQIPIVIFNKQDIQFNGADFKRMNHNLSMLYKKARNKFLKDKSLQILNFFQFDEQNQNHEANFFDLRYINGGLEQKIHQSIGILAKYEEYVLQVLNLYFYLAKDRNQKAIKSLQTEVGLSSQFIAMCLQVLGKDHQRYYKSFLNLYTAIVLEQEPLTCITQYQNHCFLLEWIKKFDIKAKSYKFFKEFTFSKEKRHQIKTEIKKGLIPGLSANLPELEIVDVYADIVVERDNDFSLSNNLTLQFIDPTKTPFPNFDITPYLDKSLEAIQLLTKYQIETFNAVLNIIRVRIELGYNDLEENKLIYHSLPNIFLAWIINQEEIIQKVPFQKLQIMDQFKFFIEQKSNWVFRFLKKAFKIFRNQQQYQPYIIQTISLAISIANTLYYLKINLCCINYIKNKIEKKKEVLKQDEEVSLFSVSLGNLGQLGNLLDDDVDEQEEQLLNQKIEDKKLLDIFEEDLLFTQFNKDMKTDIVCMGTLIYKTLECSQENLYLQEALSTCLIDIYNQDQEKIKQMNLIEIIDDDYELDLFRTVNGSGKVHTNSSKEYDYMINKAVYYIKKYFSKDTEAPKLNLTMKEESLNRKHNNNKQAQLIKQYEKLNLAIQQLINYFNLEDYNKFLPNKPKKDYIVKLQKIIFNSQIHIKLGKLLFLNVYQNSQFLDFYRLIIQFYERFVNKNSNLKQGMIPYVKQFIQLALIPYDDQLRSSTNKIPQPLKIYKLVILILEEIKGSEEKITEYIQYIFDQINLNTPFKEAIVSASSNNRNGKSWNKSLRYPNPDVLKSQAICQWFKILKSLCFKDCNVNIKINQMKILNLIIKNRELTDIVSPVPQEYLTQFAYKFSKADISSHTRDLEYQKLKLHIEGICLLVAAFKNYKQGMQEVQRFIMFESIKNAICSKDAPYMLKRAYIKVLFEAYINKKCDFITINGNEESNETIVSDEISEILSNEIIPQMETKNIYLYLEGLVRIPKYDIVLADKQWEIRKQIILEKINYFSRNKEYKALCFEDSNCLNQNTYKTKQYKGIVKNPREFWKYMMSEGILHFLADTYDEKINDIEPENSKESSLADEYSIIKTNMMKLRQLFDILERDFRVQKEELHLDQYRDLMNQIEEIIPKRKIIKFGKIFRIGMDDLTQKVNVETYDTVAEDLVGQGFQDVEDTNKEKENKITKFLRIYFMRNRMLIDQLRCLLEHEMSQGVKKLAKALFNVLNKDKIYVDHKIITNFIHYECKISMNSSQASQEKDLNPENIEIVMQVIHNFFKKAKGPKEIMEDEQEDDMAWKKKPEIKRDLNLHIYKKNFRDDIIKITQFDFLLMQTLIQKFQLEDQHDKLSYKQMKKIAVQIIQELDDNLEALLESNEMDENRMIVDVQITRILYSYLTDKSHMNNIHLEKFIEHSIQIYDQHKDYLIKMVRIFLQLCQPTEKDIDNLKETEGEIKEQALKKEQVYKEKQKIMTNQQIQNIAIRILKENSDFENKFESMTLLISMLFLGNKDCQNSILSDLQNYRDLQYQFFTYLRSFFMKNMYLEVQNIFEARKKGQKTQFEELMECTLELLRLFCENVNDKFQTFLRTQADPNDENSQEGTNIILEISNFLSFLLQDNTLEMKVKQDLIMKTINTLIDLSTGMYENQKIICQNKRLFTFINEKIIMQQRDFTHPNIKTVHKFTLEKNKEKLNELLDKGKDFDLLHSTIYFLLIIINSDQPDIHKENVRNILEQINTEQLMNIMRNIFEQRIYNHGSGKMKYIELEILCNHSEEQKKYNNQYDNKPELKKPVCTDQVCLEEHVTFEDIILTQIGFNIFIFFSHMKNYFTDKEEDIYINQLKIFAQLDENNNNIEDEEEEESTGGGWWCCPNKNKNEINQGAKKPKQKKKADQRKSLGGTIGINLEFLQQMEESKKFTVTDASQKIIENSLGVKFNSKDKEITQQIRAEQEIINYQSSRATKFFRFYKKFRGSTEIVNKASNVVQRVYFQKPFVSLYLTDFIKYHLIQESNRDSDVERIQFLKDNYIYYYSQMQHKQFISQWWILANYWRNLKSLSFYMVLVMSVMLLVMADDQMMNDENSSNFQWQKTLNQAIGISQLIISIIVVFFCAVERIPISIHKGLSENSIRKKLNLKEQAGFSDQIAAKAAESAEWINSIFSQEHVKKNAFLKFFLMLIDGENLYNIAYLGIAIWANNNVQIYPILLLDIVKQSDDLQNIIKSITSNFKNIIKFTFLGLIVIYGLIIIYWLQFDPQIYCQEENAMICDTFFDTLINSFMKGLTAGGGISDYMDGGTYILDYNTQEECEAKKGEWNSNLTRYNSNTNAIDPGVEKCVNPKYWGRYGIDLTWFILIQMLFIQIIFGIILDTFGELRGKRDQIQEEIVSKCYICGLSRTKIDEKTKGWAYHIYMEHNVYHMLFYLIYIYKRHPSDCDSLEKQVKVSLMGNEQPFFVPLKRSVTAGDFQNEEE